jgi:aldose 1-epimerase
VAAVTEVGATLASYVVDGLALLDGFGPAESSTGGRGQALLPWPNRLGDGCYEHGGVRHQLPIDEVDKRNAIHGLVRFEAWNVLDVEPDRALMGHVVHPRPGYPFVLALTIEYRLARGGLEVELVASNRGDHELPFGAGFHPYLCAGTETVDSLALTIPARTRLVLDERGLPVGREPVTGSELDYRTGRLIGDAVMDTAFTDLERDDTGIARVALEDPGSGRGVTLWMSPEFGYVMCFTGDTLEEPFRRRGVAVEPMTCPPDAFRTGQSLARLGPGASFAAVWGLEPR